MAADYPSLNGTEPPARPYENPVVRLVASGFNVPGYPEEVSIEFQYTLHTDDVLRVLNALVGIGASYPYDPASAPLSPPRVG